MAHKTRKRLTKTELKKDPINEALMKGMYYLQDHLKQLIAVGVGILVAILVIQSISSNSAQQANRSMAEYYLASQLYTMGVSNIINYGDFDSGVGQLQAAQQMARNVYRNYPGRIAGKRALILSAKVSIMFGMNSEVVSELQEFLASDPEKELKQAARIHLAIALENRGGTTDYEAAREIYNDILASTEEDSHLAFEAYSGLSRIMYQRNELEGSLENLERAMAIATDTTDFMEYQLTRLELSMN